MLIGSFHRAGRSDAFMVTVDNAVCGAATNISRCSTRQR
jgi:hypothetical protein